MTRTRGYVHVQELASGRRVLATFSVQEPVGPREVTQWRDGSSSIRSVSRAVVLW